MGSRENPTVLLIMGVSGVGKTTVAHALAARLDLSFAEGDLLHPDANIKKMSAGEPLNDADRQPWLERIGGQIQAWIERGESGVVTCSALKRSYRDLVIGGRGGVSLVYLEANYEVVRRRLLARSGHFMPSTLLESQFGTLEPPTADEHPIVVPAAAAVPSIVEAIAAVLAKRRSSMQGVQSQTA